jgi:hypothetical protein
VRLAAMQIAEDILDKDLAIDLCISLARRLWPFTWQAAMMLRRHSTPDDFEAAVRKALDTFDLAPSWCVTTRFVYIKLATARFPMAGASHTPPFNVCNHM